MRKPVIGPGDDCVNFWELLAVSRYGEGYANCHLIIATDNTQVVAMINGGSSINDSCLDVLGKIFWISAIFNVYIKARYIPGEENVFADRLSRLYPGTSILNLKRMSLCCSS